MAWSRSVTVGLVLFLCIALFSTQATAQKSLDEGLPEVREYLSQLQELGFAGVIAVSQGGRPVLAEGYGLADREQGIPWTPATVSTVGSLTKQFTGATLLLLEEQGHLSINDPISKYLDGVPDDKRFITLHQLLTHSSGIADLDDAGDFDPIGRDEFVQRILNQPLESRPGENYQYSNAGYSLLGAIIELVTGLSYEQFLRNTVLIPSGIYETGYILPSWGEGRLAQGYEAGQRWGTLLERPFDDDGPYWVLRANGGLHSTAYDMLRWAHALMTGGVLSPESMAAYWAPQISEGGDSHYGYGWSIVDADGSTLVTHDGSNGIHFAEATIVPSRELVVFLMSNVRAELPMVGQIVDQVTARLLNGTPLPTLPQVRKVPGSELETWTGVYELEGGGSLDISLEGSTLRASGKDRKGFTVLHSTRPVDFSRSERLSARIDNIVGDYVEGDYKPLWEAYDRRTPLDRLQERWDRRMRELEREHGAYRSYEILGTALRTEREITLVRFHFDSGVADRAYVWDKNAEEDLLGVSIRGLGATLTFYPEGDDQFRSWDRRTGESRPLRFGLDSDGKAGLGFGEGASRHEGHRR